MASLRSWVPACIVAQIVCILPEFDAGYLSVASAVKHSDSSISRIRHVKAIEFGHIERALRIRQTGDAVDPPARKRINNLDAVVAWRGNDYTLVPGVGCEVIQPPLHTGQRNLLYEPQVEVIRDPAAPRDAGDTT